MCGLNKATYLQIEERSSVAAAGCLAEDLDFILKSICDVTTGKEPYRYRLHNIHHKRLTSHSLSEPSIPLLLRYDFTHNYYTIPNTCGWLIVKANVTRNAAICNFELLDFFYQLQSYLQIPIILSTLYLAVLLVFDYHYNFQIPKMSLLKNHTVKTARYEGQYCCINCHVCIQHIIFSLSLFFVLLCKE